MYVHVGRSVPTFRMNLLTLSALYLKMDYPKDRSSQFMSICLPNYTASSVIKPVVYKVRCRFYDILGMGFLRPA
jgi:hypothetical protein